VQGSSGDGLQNNPDALVIIIFVILAGLLLNWLQRKYLKSMSLKTRVFFIGIGALVVGGLFYGFFYNPS
jgi:predicted membrane channel-forming protein YqfA (hemolysin III family)